MRPGLADPMVELAAAGTLPMSYITVRMPQDTRTGRSMDKLTPYRTLSATAPSGGQIYFSRWTDADNDLSWYQGLLTAAENETFWRAKNAAQRGGIANWQRAITLLTDAGWTIQDDAA